MPKGVYKRTNGNKGWFKKGHSVSKELREKIRQSKKGKTRSEETKRKIGSYRLGKKFSVEVKRKMSNSHFGIKPSVGTRAKMSRSCSGEKSHFWKGGISFLPYTTDWTKTLRRSIRERDNYVCFLCKKLQGDYAFDIHHIDYDKKNCNPDNLITLCRSCHAKTSFNRDKWIKKYLRQLDKW